MTVLMVGVLGIAFLALLGMARLSSAALEAGRAQIAADVAALAGAPALVTHGPSTACATAREFAATNGARLLSCKTRGWAIAVTVSYRTVVRRAAAEIESEP